MTTTQYKLFDHITDVDISEEDIYEYSPEVLDQLLIDHTMSAKLRKEKNDKSLHANIFWATNDYSDREGEGYQYYDEILPENITGQNGRVIMPRVLKDRQLQIARSKDKAEVFTPSWVCNAQNNLIDDAWFGRDNVFNEEHFEDGVHTWIPTEGRIEFPKDDKNKTWKKYVRENRLEITCGEAPYLVSRYDTTTGEPIPIDRRIGLLDRKLRVINENTETTGEWLNMAREAYKHTYGYEWQGDNIVLAREALLFTYIENFIHKFNKERDEQGRLIVKNVPPKPSVIGIARIISWNIWQMDGLKMVIPDSCDHVYTTDLWGNKTKRECPACKRGDTHGHIGVKCLIRDWNKKRPKDWVVNEWEDQGSSPWQKIPFVTAFGGSDEENDD